jgi:predicted transcriptional regulator
MQGGNRMIIENTQDCKQQIRRQGFTFKEFAEQADIQYPNLIKALNGDFVAVEVRAAFAKYGIRYTKRPSSAKKKLKKVA